jgi:hypothetical protein
VELATEKGCKDAGKEKGLVVLWLLPNTALPPLPLCKKKPVLGNALKAAEGKEKPPEKGRAALPLPNKGTPLPNKGAAGLPKPNDNATEDAVWIAGEAVREGGNCAGLLDVADGDVAPAGAVETDAVAI